VIGLSDIIVTSYEVARDTLRVLARCLDPRNARDYCLKAGVAPFFPPPDVMGALSNLEQDLADGEEATAEDLARLLRIVDQLVDALTTAGSLPDRAINTAVHLMLPAMLEVLRRKDQTATGRVMYVALLIVSLLDQRLSEAYPQTTTNLRLVQLIADILKAGNLRRPGEDGDEEWNTDVLVTLAAAAAGGIGSFIVKSNAYLDYGFDHPPIAGLEETQESARHAFAMFIPEAPDALEQSDYSTFGRPGPPFRRRPLVLSLVPLIRNEQHGGGIWIQADDDYVFERVTETRRIALTVTGRGGVLIPVQIDRLDEPINYQVIGELAAKFEFRLDDPSAASWSSTTEVPRGVSVRARRLSVELETSGGLDPDAPATFDVSGSARVEQAELVVGDLPVIGTIMPSGFRIPFDAGIVASLRRRELRFQGGLATELVIPLNWRVSLRLQAGHLDLTFAKVTVRTVTVRLGARTTDPQGDTPSQSGVSLEVTASLSVGLGKDILTLHADGLGFRTAFGSAPQLDGNLAGFVDAGWQWLIPRGIGLTIGWGKLKGSGFVGYDEPADRWTGSLLLAWPALFELKGIVINEPTPTSGGRSWMVVASLEFPRAGGGAITVDGIGLVFGTNRRSDPDAFLAGLGAGQLDALVLPGDPVPRMAALTAALGTLLPPSDDGEVIGVVFKIGALAGKVKVSLGILIDNGGASSALKFYVFVTVVANFPRENLQTIHIEANGVAIWDAEREEFNLRIVLRNSRLFGGELTGEAAAFYGDPELTDEDPHKTWIVSFGGFNPRYQVPGGRVYVPKRLQLTWARGDSLKIEMRAYFAITPGSLQFGGSVELSARFSGFGIRGKLEIDVIFLKYGLRFIADIKITVELRLGGRTLAGLSFKGNIKGFFPAEIAGRVSVSFLFWTWTSPRVVFSLESSEDSEETIDANRLLVASINDLANWDNGGVPGLALRPVERTGVWLSPSAPLTFRQHVLPLERTIARVGSAPLAAPATFTIEPVRPAGARWERSTAPGEFAPALYVDLSEDESLSVTGFVTMPAGFVIERPLDAGTSIELDTEHELVVIDSANPTQVPKTGTRFGAVVMGALAECAPANREPSRRSTGRPLTMRGDKFAVVTETLAPVAASVDYLEAVARVRASGDTQRIVSAVEAA
jgi:hypothetical protein